MSLPQRRAVIYTRVSSHRQSDEDRYSLPTQEAACREYAAQHGYEVAAVFTDVASASHYRHRPALSELRLLLRQDGIDAVIVHSLDRLSRDQVHLAVLLEEFREHGVRLESVLDPVEDSPVGRFLAFARTFAAELEREKLAERTQRGRRARAAAGKPIIGPKPPYGLRWSESEGRFIEVPDEANVLRYLFERVAAGASIEGLVAELTDRGIPTPTGKRQWRRATIAQLLHDERYTGKGAAYRYKTERRANGKWYRTAVPEGWTVALPEGVVPQIVSPELFAAVQRRLALNKQLARRRSKNPELFLLRGGFARCGICGGSLVTWLRNPGNGRPPTTAYVCYRRRKEYRCPGVTISQRLLDDTVWERLAQAIEKEEVWRPAIEQMLAESSSLDDELSLIERAIRNAEEQEQNLVRNLALIRDPRTAEPVIREIERLHDHVARLREEREELEAQRAVQQAWRARLLKVADWLRDLRQRLHTLDQDAKRNLLIALDVRVTVYRPGTEPRIVIDAAIPLQEVDCDQHNKHCHGSSVGRPAGAAPGRGA
jgi:site-specific DNA recombinase